MSTWQEVIKRADSDPQFRNRLKSNPAAACKEAGVSLPAGTTVKVIERQPTEVYHILDAVANGELDDAELAAVAGGTSMNIEGKVLQALKKIDDGATKDLQDLGTSTQTPSPPPPKPPRPQ
jgi:hypothetical protein